MITIVDYGMGNLGSVLNMFKRTGAKAIISSNPEEISRAEKILLPGVGAFDAAMQRIVQTGMKEVLDRKALIDKVPVLGICLGMQLLTEGSEEGILPGLGWIKGRSLAFKGRTEDALKVPHMGWNRVYPQRESLLIRELPDETRFYFVHSYFVRCENEENVLCTTSYGVNFHSVLQHENILGAQFHPEKSHKFGMKLFENFARI